VLKLFNFLSLSSYYSFILTWFLYMYFHSLTFSLISFLYLFFHSFLLISFLYLISLLISFLGSSIILFQFEYLIVIRSFFNFKFVLSFYIVHLYLYLSIWGLWVLDWGITVCVRFCFFWLHQYQVKIISDWWIDLKIIFFYYV